MHTVFHNMRLVGIGSWSDLFEQGSSCSFIITGINCCFRSRLFKLHENGHEVFLIAVIFPNLARCFNLWQRRTIFEILLKVTHRILFTSSISKDGPPILSLVSAVASLITVLFVIQIGASLRTSPFLTTALSPMVTSTRCSSIRNPPCLVASPDQFSPNGRFDLGLPSASLEK